MIINSVSDSKYNSTLNTVDFWTKPISNTNPEFVQYTNSTQHDLKKKLPRRTKNLAKLRYYNEQNIETNKNGRDNR